LGRRKRSDNVTVEKYQIVDEDVTPSRRRCDWPNDDSHRTTIKTDTLGSLHCLTQEHVVEYYSFVVHGNISGLEYIPMRKHLIQLPNKQERITESHLVRHDSQ
jgi:hypothetical protein